MQQEVNLNSNCAGIEQDWALLGAMLVSGCQSLPCLHVTSCVSIRVSVQHLQAAKIIWQQSACGVTINQNRRAAKSQFSPFFTRLCLSGPRCWWVLKVSLSPSDLEATLRRIPHTLLRRRRHLASRHGFYRHPSHLPECKRKVGEPSPPWFYVFCLARYLPALYNFWMVPIGNFSNLSAPILFFFKGNVWRRFEHFQHMSSSVCM